MHGVTSADELIKRAEDAIRMAKSSGRNCVARCGQFDGETREWEDLARQGRLFENTVARDVMVPCPVFVLGDQDAEEAAELLEQSRLSELPVVDRQGRLLGLFNADQLPDNFTRSGKKAKVCDFMVQEVATVPENESFRGTHAVLHGGQPVQPRGGRRPPRKAARDGLPQWSGGLE